MSSEEMRNELEAFVNTGLREGWCGWPLKEESSTSRTAVLPLHAGLARFWRRQDSRWTLFSGSLGALRGGGRCCMEN